MRRNDFERFRGIMNGLAKVYERELDSVLLDAYWLVLRDWTIDEFDQAAAHLMRTSVYMPRPADFNQLRTAAELTAGEAWQLVVSGGKLEPGSRAHRAAMIVGGQRHVRMANIQRDLPHIERRFIAAYDDLVDADQAREGLPQLTPPPREALQQLDGEDR